MHLFSDFGNTENNNFIVSITSVASIVSLHNCNIVQRINCIIGFVALLGQFHQKSVIVHTAFIHMYFKGNIPFATQHTALKNFHICMVI